MDSSAWVSAAVTIGVGTISGGVTNAVAVWMLFRPHEPRRWGPFQAHGAIPKNKARLAKAIGKTVGERLLTSTDLIERLRAPDVRDAFTRALDNFLDSILETDHGPLGERLDPSARAAVEGALEDLGDHVARALADYTGRAEFATTAARWAEQLDGEDGQAVDRWLAQLADSEEVADAVRRLVRGQAARMAADTTPLALRLPPSLVSAVEQGITDSVPGAIERLGHLLGDAALRTTLARALREAFNGAVREMMLHERLLAKLVVQDATMERLLSGFERDGLEKLAASLREPEVRERVRGAIWQGLESLLDRPLAERMAALGSERIQQIEAAVAAWLMGALRSDTLHRSLARGLRSGLHDEAPALIHRAMASEAGQRTIARAVVASGRALLERPIGRPASWLGAEAIAGLRRTAHERAWDWVEAQVPQLVSQLSIPTIVEQKVLGFSTQRMEEIVRTVTQKELDLIVRLGYVLGAVVGVLAWAINQFLL
jgi:uncharacterized membrane-anchored protein YjiN (DUF445 family)